MKADSLYIPKIKTIKGISTDDFGIEYEVELYNNEDGDTKVIITDNEHLIALCWIAGCDREKFSKEFKELIIKYKI